MRIVAGTEKVPPVAGCSCPCHRGIFRVPPAVDGRPCIGSDVVAQHIGTEAPTEAMYTIDMRAVGVGNGSHRVLTREIRQLPPSVCGGRVLPPIVEISIIAISISAETETYICLIAYRTSSAINTRLQRCLYGVRPYIRPGIIDIHITTYGVFFTASAYHIPLVANSKSHRRCPRHGHIRTTDNLCGVLLKRRASSDKEDG